MTGKKTKDRHTRKQAEAPTGGGHYEPWSGAKLDEIRVLKAQQGHTLLSGWSKETLEGVIFYT